MAELVKCPGCGKDVRPVNNNCPECKTPFTDAKAYAGDKCAHCGKSVAHEYLIYCPYCERPLRERFTGNY